uniref:NADH dehydrogenase [ubiquinone] 1 alpha subcomplex subunit 7 n=1 Tax=Trichuris muris TaxID=70415 RepID=A0A5S6R597_TRIMR
MLGALLHPDKVFNLKAFDPTEFNSTLRQASRCFEKISADKMAARRKMVDVSMRIQSSPLIQFLRDKLTRMRRFTQDGKLVRDGYEDCLRFPEEISARSAALPNLPGGVHHKISDNYYFERDARRMVKPPVVAYDSTANVPLPEPRPPKLDPESSRFSSVAPLPGVGYRWKRNPVDELSQTKDDPALKYLERYDSI